MRIITDLDTFSQAAYVVGFVDGSEGELCLPELYFTKRVDRELYAQGFEQAAGPTISSRYFLDNAHFAFTVALNKEAFARTVAAAYGSPYFAKLAEVAHD